MKNLKQKLFCFVSIVFSTQIGICQEIRRLPEDANLANSIPWPTFSKSVENSESQGGVSVKYLNIPVFDKAGSVLPAQKKFREDSSSPEKRHAVLLNERRLSVNLINRKESIFSPDSAAKKRRLSFDRAYVSCKASPSLLCKDIPLSPSSINPENRETFLTEVGDNATQSELNIRTTLAIQNFRNEVQSDDTDLTIYDLCNIDDLDNKSTIKGTSSFAVLPLFEPLNGTYLQKNDQTKENTRATNISLKSSRTTLRRNSRYLKNTSYKKQTTTSTPNFDSIQNLRNNQTRKINLDKYQLTKFCESNTSVKRQNLEFVSSYKLPMYQYVPPKRPVKVIVSIDGGGSRGIIPLFYLLAMYRSLELGYEKFLPIDMFVGTSVGAIVATAAIIGKLKELHDQFIALVQKIFPPQYWIVAFLRMLYYGYKYPAEGRAESIKSFLTPEIEKLVEQENNTADLVIPFCSAKTHEIFLYRNYGRMQFKLFDAIMASTAAPTYFPPHMVDPVSKNQQTANGPIPRKENSNQQNSKNLLSDVEVRAQKTETIKLSKNCELDGDIAEKDEEKDYIGKIEGTDGGCVANNPVLLALLAALKRFPGAKIRIISIGTGTNRPEGDATDKLSLLSWAAKSPTLFLDLQRALANYMVSELASIDSDRFEYTRINTILDKKNCITDGIDPNFLTHLEDLARLSISADGSAYEAFRKAVRFVKER